MLSQQHECVFSYRASGFLQFAGRHHGFQLPTTQVAEQGGLEDVKTAVRLDWCRNNQLVD